MNVLLTLVTMLMTVVGSLILGIAATYFVVTRILTFFAHQPQTSAGTPALAESAASGD